MTEVDTDHLLTIAQAGDLQAQEQLLIRYRDRLRRMINVYLDPRISARVDASDILQDALANASARMPDYLENRPLPFYPWIRQIVREELIRIHRLHVEAQRRSIRFERQPTLGISDASAMQLADHLVSREASPSQNLRLDEIRSKVKNGLSNLAEGDRELLLMRCMEKLSIKDIVAILNISETAARSRLRRAMQKLAREIKDF